MLAEFLSVAALCRVVERLGAGQHTSNMLLARFPLLLLVHGGQHHRLLVLTKSRNGTTLPQTKPVPSALEKDPPVTWGSPNRS